MAYPLRATISRISRASADAGRQNIIRATAIRSVMTIFFLIIQLCSRVDSPALLWKHTFMSRATVIYHPTATSGNCAKKKVSGTTPRRVVGLLSVWSFDLGFRTHENDFNSRVCPIDLLP